MDHVPLLAAVTKRAWTEHDKSRVAASVDEAFRLALTPHRGPVFCDFPLEAIYDQAEAELPAGEPSATARAAQAADPGEIAGIAKLLTAARRPVLVLGSDVWLGRAEVAARQAAEALRLPVIANGQARGVLPRGHELLVTRARSLAFGEADLVIVGRDAARLPAALRVVRPQGSARQGGARRRLARRPRRTLPARGQRGRRPGSVLRRARRAGPPGAAPDWLPRLQSTVQAALAADAPLLASDAEPVHPVRVYGELLKALDDDAVVIGDGGDFVSFAGRHVEPGKPGRWLDPGPFGCLGTGLGYAAAARLAHSSAQVVLLLGDGAAGLSLMDADTLVRHNLPVVIICGNNGAWGLEKQPMRAVYGYDVAADLRPGTRYDEVVRALGGAGELVTAPAQSVPRCAARSPPVSRTWSTSSPTSTPPIRAPPRASTFPPRRATRHVPGRYMRACVHS